MNTTPNTYEELWKKADSLEYKGLPKSAYETVEQIYLIAKKENDPAQQVKAIIHKLKYSSKVREDEQAFGIEDLKKEADSAVFPVKPILHSLLADLYWQYYRNNSYRFYDRTQTENFDPADIRTWDLKRLVEQTIEQHLLALKESEKLKAIKVETFDEIITENGQDGRTLRPTVFDLLAHRAIDFFMEEEPNITKPAQEFLLREEFYFLPARQFVQQKIETNDSLSYKFHAIRLMQQVMEFHLNESDPSALTDVDLKRLKFAQMHSVHPQKDELYLKSLEELAAKVNTFAVSTDVHFEIASYWKNQSEKYNPLQSEDHKWEAKKALEICQKAISLHPDSPGARNCQSLVSRIKTKEFSFVTEEANIPNKPFRARVEYRNVPKLYFKIVKTSLKELEKIREENEANNRKGDYRNLNEDIINYYSKRPAVTNFTVNLPDDKDYQKHATEVKIPALPHGFYTILTGSDTSFTMAGNSACYAFTYITGITIIHQQNEFHDLELFVLDREIGAPLPNAQVKINSKYYDYNKEKYISKTIGTFVPDKQGYLKVAAGKESRYLEFEIKSGSDEFNSSAFDEYWDYYYSGAGLYQPEHYTPAAPDIETRSLIFTDRAIYRPGHTIYFKGIVMKSDFIKNHTIEPNKSMYVSFYDVNGQEISHATLTTNEYGSYSGTFTAPATGLLGTMRISDGYGDVYVSVEEYKRPKFEVKIEKSKESFQLNENIAVKGNAKAYSGANIDHAPVKYRVVRRANFPIWWFYWKGYYPTSPEMEITSGTTDTDEKGEFTLSFKAIPDLTIPIESKPTFTYIIYADVTDINGETRSTSSEITVGYTSVKLSTSLPDLLEKGGKNVFKINSTNFSDEKVAVNGTLTIHRLKSPSKTHRKRLWNRPDKFVMTKEEFEKNFPYDEYDDESNHFKWNKEQEVLRKTFDTGKDDTLKLENLSSWKQGMYMMEIKAKDKNGAEILEVKYFTVFSPKEKELPYPTIFSVKPSKTTAEPGEKIHFTTGSSLESVNLIYETALQDKVSTRKNVRINKEQLVLEEKILEEHRGNIFYHFTFVKHNRIYTQTITIEVPYTNKQLGISFETFRNKLEPGAKEQWKLKIAGPNSEKVAAEMAATLYDASLDAFKMHSWQFDIYRSFWSTSSWSNNKGGFGSRNGICEENGWNEIHHGYGRSYDQLNWFGFYFGYYSFGYYREEGLMEVMKSAPSMSSKNGRSKKMKDDAKEEESMFSLAAADSTAVDGSVSFGASLDESKNEPKLEGVKARSNFNETAFFFPFLETDSSGAIIVNFTMPEALTRWKMLGLAHSKDLKYGLVQNELVTQKELMVTPNPPRFLREGDVVDFSAKVNNVSEKDLTGNAQLFLFDALTMKPIDELMGNTSAIKSFEVKAGLSTSFTWKIKIPEHIQAVTYKVVAKAGNFSDGEESTLPVLTNRMLVTESMPLWVKSKQNKTFTLDKLAKNNSKTLTHQKLTLEFTSNPAWYAIQALPYLMEYPYECAEQVFSRFYANSIASHIANSDPKIKKVFDTWKNIQPDALLSNLEKNEELKYLLLEETPWVREAKGESERKRRVAILFDLNRMSNELDRALEKLMKMQKGNGAWTWFEGMPEDRYMTQHIITGMGHLDHLGVKNIRENSRTWNMVQSGVGYLDRQITRDYEELKKLEARKLIKLSDNNLSYIQIQYLYARSFFPDLAIAKENSEAVAYFKGQAKTYWQENGTYMKGMIALALHRDKDTKTPKDIVKSLKEHAIHSDEMGMYWKEQWGYFWYQAPVETQALMIEVFDEVANDQGAVDEMRVWLLKQKQTQDWRTTKATTEACYALLLRGSNWLSTGVNTEIKVGSTVVDPAKIPDVQVEAGTGYFKTSWSGTEITNDMGKVSVHKKDDGVSWGGLYWQYFEQLDKITPHETPLKVKRQLFLEKNSPTGPVITPVTESTILKAGDLIKVRIELRVDRTMEYVHMKDMRAAGLEPINVLSQYKYQDGLSYYESTRDAATNFFFNYLPKGTYVFEYPLRVNLTGDYSNGITTIQCMYAPEFTSHSEGIRIKIGE